MSFTDDNLKRLKERRQEIMERPADTDLKAVYAMTLLMDIPALLARLEAAEACAKEYAPDGPIGFKLLAAWRKAAGKDVR